MSNKMKQKSVEPKRSELTIDEKLSCVCRLESGEELNSLASEFGVNRSTIWRWKGKKKQLEDFQNCKNCPRKRLRGPNNAELDESVWIWFTHSRLQGIPISGSLIKEKAKELNAKLSGNDDFMASEGWLDKWKERHNVKSVSISGEKLLADAVEVEKKAELVKILREENVSPCQLFTADETGLNFKMLPIKSLADWKNHGSADCNKNEEPPTILGCTNADGSLKLPLMVIAKSNNPHALKNIVHDTLPVIYTHETSAWINSAIFEDWFRNKFVPQVREFLLSNNLLPKAILLADNAVCRAEDLVDGDIRFVSLPPDTIDLQPLDALDDEDEGAENLTDQEIVDMVKPPIIKDETFENERPDGDVDLAYEEQLNEELNEEGEDKSKVISRPVISTECAESFADALINFFDHHDILNSEEKATLWKLRRKISGAKFTQGEK